MSTSKVKISGGPVGVDAITVDGTDVTSKVREVQFKASPGDVNQIYLSLIPDADIEIEGVVHVDSAPVPESVMESLAQWLLSRDASGLEQMALAKMGLDESVPFAQRVLEVLADMAVAGNGGSN